MHFMKLCMLFTSELFRPGSLFLSYPSITTWLDIAMYFPSIFRIKLIVLMLLLLWDYLHSLFVFALCFSHTGNILLSQYTKVVPKTFSWNTASFPPMFLSSSLIFHSLDSSWPSALSFSDTWRIVFWAPNEYYNKSQWFIDVCRI